MIWEFLCDHTCSDWPLNFFQQFSLASWLHRALWRFFACFSCVLVWWWVCVQFRFSCVLVWWWVCVQFRFCFRQWIYAVLLLLWTRRRQFCFYAEICVSFVVALKCDPDKYAVHFFAEKRLPAAICCYLWVSHVSKILSQDKKNIRQISPNFWWKRKFVQTIIMG